jgi:hypothetical protein
MSLWLDQSYLKQISNRLDRFSEKHIGTLFNCRCNLCGDSTKKANKLRGYFIAKGNQLNYFCHNCGASMSFGKYLQKFDVNLYQRYALEKFKENQGEVKRPRKSVSDSVLSAMKNIPKTQKYVPDVTAPLKKVSELAAEHPARSYVDGRKIPQKYYNELCYAPKFYTWAAGHTDKFRHTVGAADHPRLIIPWYTEDGMLFSYSARAFGDEQPKYYNIILDANHPKFYGMNHIDRKKRIYVVEGQFDSMFIPNCVAVGTSAIGLFHADTPVTYIPDRDTRNNEIMKIAKKLIESGKEVCLLPHNLVGKDINEMILQNNLKENEIVDIIDSNTVSGLSAELQFTNWRKT